MDFNKDINLFKLTEMVLARFREQSGLELSGYEFRFDFSRDWNCPIPRINLHLYVFGQEHAHTYFDEKYDSAAKVVELLFVHLRDDVGVTDLKECLTNAKMHQLEHSYKGLIQQIENLSKDRLEPKGHKKLITYVDEKFPYGETYENGFPKYQFMVLNNEHITLRFELDFQHNFDLEKVIIQKTEDEIKKQLGDNLTITI